MPSSKSKIANRAAKSIFVANVKGGVGKSTLSIMLARSLAEKIPPQNITVIDTDLQRTATEFLSKSNPEINVEFIPITQHSNTQIYLLFSNLLNKMNFDQVMLQLLILLQVVRRDYGI